MSEIEHRSLSTDLVEVRSDLRQISGLLVPFDLPTEVRSLSGPYIETFAPGSFAKTIAERGDRIPLFVQHQHEQLPIGKAVELREESRGLVGTFKVASTTAGDEALILAAEGIASGFSIGFRSIDPRPGQPQRGQAVTRREVALHEVSLTGLPVYETALIEAVRSEDVLPIAEARAQLDELRGARLPISDAYRRLADAYTLVRQGDDQ